jgi:hypothetical protein
MTSSQMQAVVAQTRELNQLIGTMEQPWLLWMRDALVDLPPGVIPLQVDLDGQRQRVRLTLELDDFDTIDAVIARLERRGRFSHLRADGHERAESGAVRVLLDGEMATAAPGVESER